MTVVRSTQEIDGREIVIKVEIDGETGSGETVYGDLRDSLIQRAARKVFDVSEDVFGEGLVLAAACAVRIVASINAMDETVRPDEYEAQFAIRLGGEGGATIVKGSADAQLQINMKWSKGKS